MGKHKKYKRKKRKPKHRLKLAEPYESDAEYWKTMDEYYASEHFKRFQSVIEELNTLLEDMPIPPDYPMPKWLADEIVDWLRFDPDEKEKLREISNKLDEVIRELTNGDADEGGDNNE